MKLDDRTSSPFSTAVTRLQEECPELPEHKSEFVERGGETAYPSYDIITSTVDHTVHILILHPLPDSDRLPIVRP